MNQDERLLCLFPLFSRFQLVKYIGMSNGSTEASWESSMMDFEDQEGEVTGGNRGQTCVDRTRLKGGWARPYEPQH